MYQVISDPDKEYLYEGKERGEARGDETKRLTNKITSELPILLTNILKSSCTVSLTYSENVLT